MEVLFISGAEIFVVMLAILLLFGSKRIPEIARGLGKGLKEIRKVTSELQNEIKETEVGKDISKIKDIADDIKNDINKTINKL